MKFTDLDTTQARSETTRIDLDGYQLNLGGKSISLDGQWIDVLPVDSDEFQQAKLEQQRKAITDNDYEPESLVAAIIKDWSFDEPCNEENKIQAMKIWPRVLKDQIDRVASRAVNFTKAKPKSSQNTQKRKAG